MKNIKIGESDFTSSRIILGCMRIKDMTVKECERLVLEAVDLGVKLFDQADIYGGGRCEELYGEILSNNKGLREKIHIQTKCSIRDGYYDMSKEHIIASVDNSLKRLKTDYIDMLLIHRPDTLMEPSEVAEAFNQLEKSGKVRNFGVSNFNSMQIELLKTAVSQKLLANQLQYGIMNCNMVSSGIQANTMFHGSYDRDGHILEYSRINNMTIQAWSPFQYGFFEGSFLDNDKFVELNVVLDRIAHERGVSKSAIAIAWILRHPANMQVICGTTNINHLKEICSGDNIVLTRKEWYEIYKAAGNIIP